VNKQLNVQTALVLTSAPNLRPTTTKCQPQNNIYHFGGWYWQRQCQDIYNMCNKIDTMIFDNVKKDAAILFRAIF